MFSDDRGHKGRRNTKEEILNTSIELFSEYGISAVSIRDITKRVGINESSLYNHYKNKDEILKVIIGKFRHDFGRAFSADAGDLRSRMEGIGPEVFFQHHVLDLRDRMSPTVQKIWKIIYLEMFRDKRVRDFFVNEALKVSSSFYEKVFEIMAEKGLIKAGDARLLADEFNFGFMAMQIENMLLKTDNRDIDENVKRLFAHIRFICAAAVK